MFDVKLYTKKELQEMLDNTKGFFDYCKLQEQFKRDEDAYGALSWLFNPGFVPSPVDPENAKKLTKDDVWWIDKTIQEAFKRAMNTPMKFRV